MEQLGINPVLLVAQMLSFGILFGVFNKFLFPMIQKALNERREAVAMALSGKEEMEQKLKQFEEDRKKQKKADEAKTRELLAESKKQAETEKKQIIESAEKAAERERIKAEQRISTEVETAKKELNKQVLEMATKMARKVLEKEASSDKWQRNVIKDNLKALDE